VPTSQIPVDFRQDQSGKLILNGGGNPPQAQFHVVTSSNTPALIVDQKGVGKIVEFLDAGISKVTIDGNGLVGIGTSTPLTSLDLKQRTDAIIMPQGTLIQRPSDLSLGQVRFNTFTKTLEMYDGFQWTSISLSPSIPVDNLMLFLDAGNSLSYPGTGTTWSSLVAPQLNGTISGATYNSNGYLTFNGTNSYVDITLNNPAGAWVHSISFWMQLNADQSTYGGSISPFQIGNQATPNKYSAFHLSNNSINWYFYSNDTFYYANIFSANTWYHVVLTYAGGNANIVNKKMYVNNINYPLISSSTSPLDIDANAVMSIGRDKQRNIYYFPGKIANFQIYNRVITPLEVSNIYNSMKSRFQLPLQYSPGCIIQVQQGVLNVKQTIAAADGATWTPITNLFVTITPASINSKFLLSSKLNVGITGGNGTTAAFRFVRVVNSVATSVGIGNTTGDAVSFRTATDNAAFNSWTFPACGDYLDSPYTTLPITYKLEGRTYNTSYTVTINSSNAGGGLDAAVAISTLSVYEIAS
jgi:hypothetical protein